MLPTPSTSHVPFTHIYEPAEDSYLLLDTLSSPSETAYLTNRFATSSASATHETTSPPPVVLEVGTGSGVVLAFVTAHAHAIFGRSDALTIGTDINRHACQATGQTVVKAVQTALGAAGLNDGGSAAAFLDSVRADLTTPLRAGMVDVLVFNPPYVPTSERPTSSEWDRGEFSDGFEEESCLLSLAYAGGVDGMEITNRLLEQVPLVLNPQRGVAYVLLCAQNRPEEVKQRIAAWGPAWSVETVGRSGKVGGWEKLQILRLSRV
ncbi:MAG: hypothetical protein LQ347_006759 [Umbilicaria vellea]|nr:MAG: hypothetical protein LQ347_006759 [Umbilicaria vellea]